MDDRIDRVFINDLGDESRVSDVADDKFRLWRNRPFKTGGQPVYDDDPLTRVEEFPDHVAADIASASGYKYRHFSIPNLKSTPP
jgi:hypothetical protein